MANILRPTIKRIIRINEYDLLRIKVSMGNMYMCQDSMKLYYDQGNSSTDRVLYNYTSIRTVNDLKHRVSPVCGVVYYCWEDNSLWLWNNKWECLYSDSTYPSAYNYGAVPSPSDPQTLDSIYRYDMPNAPADDNGLLKDGSVCVRDENRLIKGRIYIAEDNDNFVISSYLGGGIRFLPNGRMSSEGEFIIDDEGISKIRSQFRVLNNELYIDYSESPGSDESAFPNTSHIYKVFHEGNLDTSTLLIMTPLQIYNKLLDDSLPDEFDFNVNRFQGHTPEDFAPSIHNHTANQITDLITVVDDKCEMSIRHIFNTMSSTGITSSYNPTTNHLTLRVNPFTISFNGGATGSCTVTNLESAVATLNVIPTAHVHADLINELEILHSICDDLQRQIDELRGD